MLGGPRHCALCAGFVTSLFSDKTQLNQIATSLNSALELAQEAGLNLAAIASRLEERHLHELTAQLRAQQELTQQLIRLPAGSSAVVTNGRAVVVNSPALGLSDEFAKEDFALLVRPVLLFIVQHATVVHRWSGHRFRAYCMLLFVQQKVCCM